MEKERNRTRGLLKWWLRIVSRFTRSVLCSESRRGRVHKNGLRGLIVIGAYTSERDGEGNITNSPKTARSYARKHNYTYTFTYGSDAFKDVCLVRGLPTMLIVDRDGTVRDVIVGFSQDLKNELAEKLNPLL